MTEESQRFRAATERIDAANAEDPGRDVFEGEEFPRELLYSWRMTAWLEQLAPEASEALRLAARCQHICRWKIPRSDYPQGRRGYHLWRTRLARFHADLAGEILAEVGYGEETIRRVQSLLRKEGLKTDPEMQLLEDVICLVFLENYFSDFAGKQDEEKLIGIIRKTWKKMSSRGQREALDLPLRPADRALIERALKEEKKE